MAQRCQVCLKKAAVWNNALRKFTCNECAIAQANAQANARQPTTAVQVQYTPCPLCLYAATVGVQSPHPQNVNPHPIPTVADWMALNATIQQRNMAYTQQALRQASLAQRSYASALLPRRHPSLLGSLVRHYVNGATGGGTMSGGGGGGGVDYSSLFGGGGGGGVDYSAMFGGGGVDYSSMLGGGGFDFSSMFGGGGFN